MTSATRRLLAWCVPLPLLALPWLAMRAHDSHPPAPSGLTRLLSDASTVLIAPGMICGIALRSGIALVLTAGLCWYLLGAGAIGLVLSPPKQRKASRVALYFGLAWLVLILAFGIMWANADID